MYIYTLYTSPYVPEPIFWISSYSSCGFLREISELSMLDDDEDEDPWAMLMMMMMMLGTGNN